MVPRVLLIDDDPVFGEDLRFHFAGAFELHTVVDPTKAEEQAIEVGPDVILLDIELGGGFSGIDLLPRLRNRLPGVPVIMVTRHEASTMAAAAWQRGAFGYVEKGARVDVLAAQLRRAIEEAVLSREKDALRREIAARVGQLVGESPGMMKVKEHILRVAGENSTVLILGETGTGKELVARAIHDASPRRNRLFVAVNCAAIPAELAESELFGHEKGAFTGATNRRLGRFGLADGGTIFLDEVSETSLQIQAKLLRVLQERVILRVGAQKEEQIDVRVIAATNKDLLQMVRDGRFREDLYYRLYVYPIRVPPLRERKEDIRLLAEHLVRRKAEEMNRGPVRITEAAIRRLMAWDWPGNVRELENAIEYAMIRAAGNVLDEPDFADLVGPGLTRFTYAEARKRVLEKFERDYVTLMLRETGGNVSEAARRMGVTRQGLQKMMKRLGIRRGAMAEPSDS